MVFFQRRELDARPMVDWLAGQIPSPVLRLRFLRTVMLPDPRRRYRTRALAACLAAMFLVEVPVSAPRVRAAEEVHQPFVPAVHPLWPAVRLEERAETWEVEKTDTFETYSNGLRIDNRFATANRPRSYLAFSAVRAEDTQGERRSAPAGIVFHTTESMQAPFEPGQNSNLKRIGEALLAYVKLRRSYNFVIDRFGRVYRIVQEGDAANHAGNSVWADSEWLYVNLNQSFLGVSFETETMPGQTEAIVNPAQMRSAAVLTEMLRKRYGIAAGNCVTHAQVSVNASNLLAGYHMDWASSFPFETLGLPDNYARPLPAVAVFGFDTDSSYANLGGARLYRGVELGESVLRERAAAARLPVPAYRKALQRKFLAQWNAVRADAIETEQEE